MKVRLIALLFLLLVTYTCQGSDVGKLHADTGYIILIYEDVGPILKHYDIYFSKKMVVDSAIDIRTQNGEKVFFVNESYFTAFDQNMSFNSKIYKSFGESEPFLEKKYYSSTIKIYRVFMCYAISNTTLKTYASKLGTSHLYSKYKYGDHYLKKNYPIIFPKMIIPW